MVQKFLGVVILVAVVMVTVVWQWQRSQRPPAVAVMGHVGGEKHGSLQNPEVQTALSHVKSSAMAPWRWSLSPLLDRIFSGRPAKWTSNTIATAAVSWCSRAICCILP